MCHRFADIEMGNRWREKGGGGVVGSDVTCSSIFSLSIVSEIAPLIFFPFCVSQDVFS